MGELRVRYGNARRVVCGINESTSSRDVIFALAQASNKVGTFYLCDTLDGRALNPDDSVAAYCGRGEPTLFLRCVDDQQGDLDNPLRFGSERARKSSSPAQRRLTRFSSQRNRRLSLASGVQFTLNSSQLSLSRSQLTLASHSGPQTPLLDSTPVTMSRERERANCSTNTLETLATADNEECADGRLSLAMSARWEHKRLQRECCELSERLRMVDAQLSDTNALIDKLQFTLEQVAIADSFRSSQYRDRLDERQSRSRSSTLELEHFRYNADNNSVLHYF